MMDTNYYNQKLKELFAKMFTHIGSAKERFLACEKHLSKAYDASMIDGIPHESQLQWREMWKDLNSKDRLKVENRTIKSSLEMTLEKRQNRSLEKYLIFIYNEYIRIKYIELSNKN